MKRLSISGVEKRFLVGGTLAFLLLGGFALALSSAKKQRGIPPHAPMPNPNGFDLYAAAANAMTRPNPPVDEINDTKKRSPQEAAKFYSPARRATFVAANAKTWNLMKQAREAQTQHPDIRANIMAKMPYGPFRDLARGKTIEAKHFKESGRWDLALASGLDTIEMGRDIEHGAPLIGSLVGMAIVAISAASMEDVPSHLNATAAKNGARRLEKVIASGTSPADVLREEKWTVLTNAQNNFGTQPNRVAGLISRPFSASIGPMMDEFIAESEKPFALQTVPPTPTGFFSALSATLHPVFARSGFNFARREAHESGLLLRLALRAYRVENGAYPANLAQLAPKYLAKVPRDPFGRGEAMRYRKTGDGYLAWSIGPDGKNNGGQGIAIKTGKKRVVVDAKSLGDVIFKP